MDQENKDKLVSAVCGLYCRACSLYIATEEDGERISTIANLLGQTVEESRCTGCHSEQLSIHCAECVIKACAEKKNVLFCAQCDEFPCERIKEFQSKAPHRAELWEALELTNKLSIEYWVKKMEQLYACEDCGTINSAYDINCRQCGKTPSNPFVQKHIDLIKKHLKMREE